MAKNLASLLRVVLPKRRFNEKGTAYSPTFREQNTTNILTIPTYREHLTDLFTSRQGNDSRVLLRELFKHDPDVSAAVSAYLTLANTKPMFFCKTVDGEIDRKGHRLLNQVLLGLTTRIDYSGKFEMTRSLRALCEEMRYMLLLRGAVAAELVMRPDGLAKEIRQVDMATVEWFERAPSVFEPRQRPVGANDTIDLNFSNFLVSYYRRDPVSVYSWSPFVSVVNTVAARQQVINDLYRIMQRTGFGRMDIEVIEEVIRKNAPANIRNDGAGMREYVRQQITDLTAQISSLRADQAFVHTDTVKAQMLNDAKPAAAMNIDSVMGALNAQNQAALRTMATIIGRGTSGVNTASVEARVFAMNADGLNEPIADLLSNALTMAVRVNGYQGYVECRFEPVEMRPYLELEAQRTMRQARLLDALSHGVITDDEFHMEMYGRIRPDAAPELAGTGFMNGPTAGRASEVTPNSDPLGRSLAPEGSDQANSNGVSGNG